MKETGVRVTLAYPYEGHDPDKTIDLDDATATALVKDGLARPADDKAHSASKKKDSD